MSLTHATLVMLLKFTWRRFADSELFQLKRRLSSWKIITKVEQRDGTMIVNLYDQYGRTCLHSLNKGVYYSTRARIFSSVLCISKKNVQMSKTKMPSTLAQPYAYCNLNFQMYLTLTGSSACIRVNSWCMGSNEQRKMSHSKFCR